MAVVPHVVNFNVPPGAAPAPSDRAYTSREPGKKALKPDAQLPEVYIPGLPSSAVDRGEAAPLGPTRGSVRGRPRHMGGDEVGDGVVDGVAEEDLVTLGDGVALAVALGDGVPVRVEEPVLVVVATAVGVRVPEVVDLGERVWEPEAVPVRLPVEVGVGEPVCETELVGVGVLDCELVPLSDVVPVLLPEPVPQGDVPKHTPVEVA